MHFLLVYSVDSTRVNNAVFFKAFCKRDLIYMEYIENLEIKKRQNDYHHFRTTYEY